MSRHLPEIISFWCEYPNFPQQDFGTMFGAPPPPWTNDLCAEPLAFVSFGLPVTPPRSLGGACA